MTQKTKNLKYQCNRFVYFKDLKAQKTKRPERPKRLKYFKDKKTHKRTQNT